MNMYLRALAEAIDGPKEGYAWKITEDHLFEEFGDRSEVGVTGPRTATDDDLARLEKGEGDTFKLYDGDGQLYYTGRLVVSGDTTHDDEQACFGPLDDFGAPNAGCTTIKWPGHPDRNNG